MSTALFQLTIRTRDAILYNGKVSTITSENEKGIFSILSTHENFLSILKNNLTFVDEEGSKRQVFVERGLMRVAEGVAVVFLGFKPT